MNIIGGGISQGCSAANDRGGPWGGRRVAMVIEPSQIRVGGAGGTTAKSSTKGCCHGDLIINPTSHAELCSKRVSLVCATHLSAEGGCPEVERVGHRTSSCRRVEIETGPPLAALGLKLLLLLLKLKLLLELSLSKEFCLVLLGLNRLNPHHLELKHLDLHLGLGRRHVGREARAEWDAVGVHASGGLLMREAVVRPVYGSGHGRISRVEHVLLGHLGDLVVLLLFWEDVGAVLGRETRDVERASRSCGVGNIGGGGTDTACAETCEKRSTIVRVCGSHCFVESRTDR